MPLIAAPPAASSAPPTTNLRQRVAAAVVTGVTDVVVPGRHERPPGSPRTGGRRWRRVVCAVLLGVYALVLVTGPFLAGEDQVAAVPALLLAVALVALVWRPLDAWRLATTSLLVLHLVKAARPDADQSDLLDATTLGWPPVLLVAALAAPVPVLVGLWVVSAAALVVMGLLTPAVGDLDVAVPLLALPLLVGTAVRVRRDARERVAEAGGLTQAERDARVAMAERARIAREMHDLVAHHLSAVAVRAETAPFRRPGLPPAALEELDLLAASAREALHDMQSLLGVLRSEDPAAGPDRGPGPDDAAAWRPQPGEGDLVPLLVDARATGTDVTWSVELDRPLPDPVGLTLYRALAQGLANARQHAAGAPVRVTLRSPAGPPAVPGDHAREGATTAIGMRLTVTSAAGRDHGRGSGLGLPALHERVAVHSGVLLARPAPEGGFVLDVWVPWTTAAPGPVPDVTAPLPRSGAAGDGRGAR